MIQSRGRSVKRSAITLGVMHLPNLDHPRTTGLLMLLRCRINFFDNADIYGDRRT